MPSFGNEHHIQNLIAFGANLVVSYKYIAVIVGNQWNLLMCGWIFCWEVVWGDHSLI